MYRKCCWFILILALTLAGGCFYGGAAKKPVPQNKPGAAKTIQEAAGLDPFQEGCVSCHKKTAEVDRSLPAYVQRFAGHPKVTDASVNACYKCHEAETDYSLYKKFYRGIHRAHWQSETFFQSKGSCFSCHTVESNGVAGLKKYPLAGYRAGIISAQPKTQTGPEPREAPKSNSTTESKTVPESQPAKQSPAPEPQSENQGNQNQQGQSGKLFENRTDPSPTS